MKSAIDDALERLRTRGQRWKAGSKSRTDGRRSPRLPRLRRYGAAVGGPVSATAQPHARGRPGP